MIRRKNKVVAFSKEWRFQVLVRQVILSTGRSRKPPAQLLYERVWCPRETIVLPRDFGEAKGPTELRMLRIHMNRFRKVPPHGEHKRTSIVLCGKEDGEAFAVKDCNNRLARYLHLDLHEQHIGDKCPESSSLHHTAFQQGGVRMSFLLQVSGEGYRPRNGEALKWYELPGRWQVVLNIHRFQPEEVST